MESNDSLIVKLPLKLCDTCVSVLSRWREPAPPRWQTGSSEWYPANYLWNQDKLKPHYGEAKWNWRARDLRTSAAKCVCCCFLVECLDASPWMQYQDDDIVQLKSALVGSSHTSPDARDAEDNQLSWSRQLQKSEYNRYHRPRLLLFKKEEEITEETEEDDEAGSEDEELYYFSADLFILPLPRSRRSDIAGFDYSRPFHGRLVNAHVDFALVDSWCTTCKDHHTKPKDQSPYYTGHDPNHCEPAPMEQIPYFRLVDVQHRCIVLANTGQEYAALSYVWGNAKRLLLCTDNLAKLSTPGALNQNSDDLPKTFRDALLIAEKLGISYLWIDAICILQDHEEQLVSHMNVMDSIYSSAIITIVSDTNSADSGIPGVGYARGPPQATFKAGGETFISSKRTFGAALKDSFWESRGWCLQEKVFSRRLLIFTSSQAFYHCNCGTWFEDTIMESMERNGDSVTIAERSSPSFKDRAPPSYTAYEAHRGLFGKNFWTLVETYSLRQLSFESDSVRAFSGILKSVEFQYGPAIWGIPQSTFSRGLTWHLSPQKMSLRRQGFPSWSWAGWRGNTGSSLHFDKVLVNSSDTWNIEWHYYCLNGNNEYELTYVKSAEFPEYISNANELRIKTKRAMAKPRIQISSEPYTWGGDFEDSNSVAAIKMEEKFDKSYCTWMLPGHPGEVDYEPEIFPPFHHDPATMPPLSYILRFYTSVATLVIDRDPDPNAPFWKYGEQNGKYHAVRVPHTSNVVSHISVDDLDWFDGKRNKEGTFIYISRSHYPAADYMPTGMEPQLLNIMLIEGDGEVKTKVQQGGTWTIDWWRKAVPTWKLITLA